MQRKPGSAQADIISITIAGITARRSDRDSIRRWAHQSRQICCSASPGPLGARPAVVPAPRSRHRPSIASRAPPKEPPAPPSRSPITPAASPRPLSALLPVCHRLPTPDARYRFRPSCVLPPPSSSRESSVPERRRRTAATRCVSSRPTQSPARSCSAPTHPPPRRCRRCCCIPLCLETVATVGIADEPTAGRVAWLAAPEICRWAVVAEGCAVGAAAVVGRRPVVCCWSRCYVDWQCCGRPNLECPSTEEQPSPPRSFANKPDLLSTSRP